MASTAFSWTDGVGTYTTLLWAPKVAAPTEAIGQVVRTLDGGAVWAVQVDATGHVVIPQTVTLSWDVAPAELLPIASDTFTHGRAVTVVYPWRASTATLTGRVVSYQETPREVGMSRLEVTITAVGL